MTTSDKNSGRIDYLAHPRVNAQGVLRGVMLFVDFPDAPATESAAALFQALVPGAQRWFSRASYGQVSLEVTPVYSWFRMPRASTTYLTRANSSFELHRQLMQQAVDAADPTVDFRGYRLLYVVAAHPSGIDYSPGFTPLSSDYGVRADGTTFVNGALFGADARDSYPDAAAATLVHETLHTFGLPDLWHFGEQFPSSEDFVGGWSIMSSKANLPGILAWERLQLGWLDRRDVVCMASPGQQEVTLAPLEGSRGVKAIVIKTSATTFVVAEARTRLEEDRRLCDAGVLVYTVDTRVEDGHGSIRVQPALPDDGSRDSDRCSLYYRAARLPDAESEWRLDSGNVAIRVLARANDGFVLSARLQN